MILGGSKRTNTIGRSTSAGYREASIEEKGRTAAPRVLGTGASGEPVGTQTNIWTAFGPGEPKTIRIRATENGGPT